MPGPCESEPWPPRPYGWAALLDDGTAVLEFGPPGVWRRWDDLPLSRVRAVGIVRYPASCPVADVDLVSGRFRVGGKEIALRLDGAEAGPFEPAAVRPLQYKAGHAEWRPGGAQSGTVVDAYHVGYEALREEGRLRAVLRLDAPSDRVGLEVHAARRGGAARDVAVLVDGEPVQDARMWEAAVGRWRTLPDAAGSRTVRWPGGFRGSARGGVR